MATCPSPKVLVGCWCQSLSSSEKECARLWTDGNSCRARTGPGRVNTGPAAKVTTDLVKS